MKPETLQEDFTVYDLSNDMTLSVKTIIGKVNKTKFHKSHIS